MHSFTSRDLSVLISKAEVIIPTSHADRIAVTASPQEILAAPLLLVASHIPTPSSTVLDLKRQLGREEKSTNFPACRRPSAEGLCGVPESRAHNRTWPHCTYLCDHLKTPRLATVTVIISHNPVVDGAVCRPPLPAVPTVVRLGREVQSGCECWLLASASVHSSFSRRAWASLHSGPRWLL